MLAAGALIIPEKQPSCRSDPKWGFHSLWKADWKSRKLLNEVKKH